MSHRNARLNERGRQPLVQRVRVEGWAVAHTAKAQGVSRQCAHRGLSRFDEQGANAMVDRSSRPRRSRYQTPVDVEQRVLAVRREQRRGQDWIRPEVGVAPRKVSRILRRHGVPHLRECDPLTGEVIRSSKTTAVRYERDAPGDLVHMDGKKIGEIPDGGGWKAHGRQMGSTGAKKRARIGYDYVHSLVDDHSRLAYSEILDDEKGPTCAGFLARAAAYFAAHGITRIREVMTDNHFSYAKSHDTRDVIAALGAKHRLIKPHCPWQNGKVERFNRTLQTEWAHRRVFLTNADRAAAPAPWLEFYNTERRHTALGGLPPTSRLSPT
ncbi:IS481 family transposase [Demequina sediminicola]|uniref:IS481 family transposase n=1 Tax=Demequina sediminicola TaxID=1095026 RepID=UPI0007828189|nr:IS481 family transposase [Demequina sediminicola]